jgi:hypothetical protein
VDFERPRCQLTSRIVNNGIPESGEVRFEEKEEDEKWDKREREGL